jgi:hypothetical protein
VSRLLFRSLHNAEGLSKALFERTMIDDPVKSPNFPKATLQLTENIGLDFQNSPFFDFLRTRHD